MKKVVFLLVLMTTFTNAQIVNIPDANLNALLLASDVTNGIAYGNGSFIKIDANNDGAIQLSEAQLVTKLTLAFNSACVTSFTGLESFTNITQLSVSNNCGYFVNLPLMPSVLKFSYDENSANNSSTIDFTNFINLQELTVHNGGTNNTININGLSSLIKIDASYTKMQSINLTGTPNLEYLNLSDCIIGSLDVTNLHNLQYLNCHFNGLTNLDVSQNHLLTTLDCSRSDIVSLNIKNGSTEQTLLDISSMNHLQFICIDENQLTQVQNLITQNNYSNVAVNSYCSFTPGGNYNTITGNIKFDADNNGCDLLDLPRSNIRIDLNDGTNAGGTFTDNLGNYNFYTQTGSFDLTPNIENPTWFTFSPTTATIPFANSNNNSTIQNFCITSNGNHPDLEIVVAPIAPARPGFDALYQIVFKNKGNQTLSGALTFNYDDSKLDFVNASQAPSNQQFNTLTWDYTNLIPFENRSIYVRLNVNSPQEIPAVNIGDVLQFSATINPVLGDELPNDNVFSYNQTVVGSYDPNDVVCIEGNVVAPSQIGEYLHYIINFENTGTAAAENIVVKTEVNSNDFDINNLQVLNTSANCFTKITGNKVEFIFKEIMLDSGGHGNVLLKIKSKDNLQVGDMVSKQANIYFDYNLPISTNTASTTFQALNNGQFVVDNSIVVSPNPTKGNVIIIADSIVKSIQLYDVQGRLLETKLTNDINEIIDISEKSTGIYFLKITSEVGSKVEKIVKE